MRPEYILASAVIVGIILPAACHAAQPAAPTNLRVTATGINGISLNWRDNSNDESGFKVERCLGVGCTGFIQVATLTANSTDYSDSALAPQTTYSYRVHAFNPAGDSALSNILVATTLAPWLPIVSSPYIFGVTNSASFESGAPDGQGIAQGSLFVIFGGGIGPTVLQQVGAFPLPPQFAGTSVKVTVGSSSVDAIMAYTSTAVVAAILPSRTPTGVGSLTVTYNGQKSNSVPIKIVPSAFGVYSVSSNGVGPGSITASGYRLNSFSASAGPGETLTIWGTGLGPVAGDEAGGPLIGNQFPAAQVFVGGRAAAVHYAGRSGCCAGLDQIAFDVPPGLEGCFVPVAVRNGGVVSNYTSIAVASGGGQCTDPVGIPWDVFVKAANGQDVRLGGIAIGPTGVLATTGSSYARGVAEQLSELLQTKVPEDEVSRILRSKGPQRQELLKQAVAKYKPRMKAQDVTARAVRSVVGSESEIGMAAQFGDVRGVASVVAQFASSFPAVGSCTVNKGFLVSANVRDPRAGQMDAGRELVVTTPTGTRVAQQVRGHYQLKFGAGFVNQQLPVGSYSVSGSGGADVGPFVALLNLTSDLRWTNKDAINSVDRSKPLTITWTGGPASGYVLFGGAASLNGVGTAFTCIADSNKGALTVPDFVLGAMPPTASDPGYLYLGAHPMGNRFAAPGLDLGYLGYFGNDSKEVAFR